MVEVREKRALFISSVLSRLQLTSTHIFRGPVEHFFQGQYYKADCILSRAFMDARLYNSLMVQLLVGEPQDPRISPYFKLVYDNVFARIYEVL
jgi:Predicted S-adenosylmethionine-dependent methyltransferase involved in bacterial cell division